MLRGTFSNERPKDCCANCQWAKAARSCPVSTEEIGVVPWLIDGFYPFRSFMKLERYKGRISRNEIEDICEFLNKSVKEYPDVPSSCCILGLTIPFMSIAPGLAALMIIFLNVWLGILFLLLIEGLLVFFLVSSCINSSKKDGENKRERRAILERNVYELNTTKYLDSDFTIHFVYDHKEDYHYLRFDVAYIMGGVKPNRMRYGIQGLSQQQQQQVLKQQIRQNYDQLHYQYAHIQQQEAYNNRMNPVGMNPEIYQNPAYFTPTDQSKPLAPPPNQNYAKGNGDHPQVNMNYPIENAKDAYNKVIPQ